MFAYSFDDNGFFSGIVEMQSSPLEPGIFLLPAKATTVAPLRVEEGFLNCWNGEKWVSIEIPIEDSEEPGPSEQATINLEAESYLRETDWYIIREMDCGTPCPSDVKQKRAEARAKIVRP